ncbi:hypothetical protein FRB98_009642 [Tulasnella sp. 332]|nr:hypothetical protein FRB98_009642 [Tulasnella sp. 332]
MSVILAAFVVSAPVPQSSDENQRSRLQSRGLINMMRKGESLEKIVEKYPALNGNLENFNLLTPQDANNFIAEVRENSKAMHDTTFEKFGKESLKAYLNAKKEVVNAWRALNGLDPVDAKPSGPPAVGTTLYLQAEEFGANSKVVQLLELSLDPDTIKALKKMSNKEKKLKTFVGAPLR